MTHEVSRQNVDVILVGANVGIFGGNLFDVIARITAFGKLDFLTERFAVARHDGKPEIVHLIASVVDIVLTLDVKPGRLMQARQHVADHSDAAVTDVQRTGGIDAGELDLNSFTLAKIEPRILSRCDLAQSGVIKFWREGEI